MEVAECDDAANLLRECVGELSAIEAAFIEECYLSEPRKSLKAFAEDRGLRQKQMAELRVRAMRRLREELATKKVYGVSDIL